MYSRQGPIYCDCDAPPYSVVGACETLGFHSPLDVRWLPMSWFLRTPRQGGRDLNPWRWLFRAGRTPRTSCTCGQPLPSMECCVFLFASGEEVRYFLGQCPVCRTMFWDEAGVHSEADRSRDGW